MSTAEIQPPRGPLHGLRLSALITDKRTYLAEKIKTMPYLPKWVILATVIGTIAGLGAILFYGSLTLATHFFLSDLAGYNVPTPAGEGGLPGSLHYVRAWSIPLVVILGGLLSGIIVFTWAPEAEGHGTDAAINAIHHNARGIRIRAVVVKIIASAITIGSGGSGGREGPTAQISAGFGSFLARILDLSPEDGRVAVSVGIGSGIGAIFGAPLGGAVLAADIVYRDDFEFEALLPGTLASVIAFAIFGSVFGYQPMFHIAGGYDFTSPTQLFWFAILGAVAGGMGLIYSRSFYSVVNLSSKLRIPNKIRPAAGAAITGLIALWMPEVLGTGYGWAQKAMSAELAQLPLYFVLLLPFARIIATSFSIGSGGSGGVFGPGMVIGSFTGLAFWDLLKSWAPGVSHDPMAFVVIGMMAVFGSISRAPIAVMLMVGEMTGSMSILAPAMIAVAVAWFIVARVDDSIYRSQLRTKADSPARQLTFGLPLLTSLSVKDILCPPQLVLQSDASAEQGRKELLESKLPGAPVVNSSGKYLGIVTADRIAQHQELDPDTTVYDLMEPAGNPVSESAKLETSLEVLLQSGMTWVPVTAANNQLAGVLSFSDIVRGYNNALDSKAGYMYSLTSRAIATECRVGKGAVVAGKKIREAGFPPGCVIVWVQHEGNRTYATGTTEIAEGDIVNAIVTTYEVANLHRILASN